jgi:two-component system, LytTR family, response regulator
MIKAIIVEDEPRDQEVLLKALRNYCTGVDIVATAGSVAEAEKIIKERPADLLFLDIELPDGRAFDLLGRIQDVPIKIIFTTAHPEYAVKAFRFSAVDYLLKPINFNDLKNAVEKVKEGIRMEIEKNKIQFLLEGVQQNNAAFKKIAIPDRKSVKFIQIDDIIFIEADSNYSRFKLTGNQDLLSSHNLKEYEDMLAEHCFTRVSKSHVVNLNHVNEYRSCGELVTDTNDVITVGRQYRDNFLEKMTNCKK